MAKIKPSDVIFAQKETLHNDKYQLKLVVDKVMDLGVGNGRTAKFYDCHYIDEPNAKCNVFHKQRIGMNKWVSVRKTPHPDIPLITTRNDEYEFCRESRLKRKAKDGR